VAQADYKVAQKLLRYLRFAEILENAMRLRLISSHAAAATGRGSESARKALERQSQTKPKPQELPKEAKYSPPVKQQRKN
jgi:hypothetical protein